MEGLSVNGDHRGERRGQRRGEIAVEIHGFAIGQLQFDGFAGRERSRESVDVEGVAGSSEGCENYGGSCVGASMVRRCTVKEEQENEQSRRFHG